MMKKLFCTVFAVFAVMTAAGAVGNIFPASRTDIDGVTRSGYLDEDGRTVLSFSYATAGDFAPCGLAAVEDDKWQTAVIDREGKLVIDYTESPVSVDFSDDMVAYRYADHSVYYTLSGTKIGSYPGAEGFFEDGLLLCRDASTGLYSFVKQDGTAAFSASFAAAGAFSDGLALVRSADSGYLVLDTEGKTVAALEAGADPAYYTVYGGDTVVMTNGTNYALYSISKGAYLTDFLYNVVSEFHDGAAMVRQINRWGIIDTKAKLLTNPTYYYLSYMGEGLYAARSEDGSVAAVDASGNIAYRTLTYIGGFNELRYGLSWHGMADGSLIFFKKNGGYFASLKNAENPTLLSENVVRVTQDGTIKYINLSTGKTLLSQATSFDLGSGITAKTVHYEKFMGYQSDGTEHGWNVDFPEISGLADAEVQKTINADIRAFFLKGPSVTAEYEALEGTYGASVEGSVLVVWANCVSGRGMGAAVWNNSLAFDMNTGKQYRLTDLLTGDYIETVKKLLPAEHEVYLYSFPRISAKGVTYYYNEYESATRRAYTESYLLTYEALGAALYRKSACYAALLTPYTRPAAAAKITFSDVPASYWAAEYIEQAASDGLMTGSQGAFRPEATITEAEVCMTLARREGLDTASNSTVWYAGAMSSAENAGLLDGVTAAPEKAMTRADTMQVFANVLVRGGAALPDEQQTADTLKNVKDAASIPADRRAAVALCMERGLISGYEDGTIRPQQTITRAAFAKLMVTAEF